MHQSQQTGLHHHHHHHHNNNNNKAHAGSRRRNRNTIQCPTQRVYASESDMLTDVQSAPADFAPVPRTPQKSSSASPSPASCPVNPNSNSNSNSSSNSKQRPRNKPRPKNVSVSPVPVVTKTDRLSPPPSALPKPTSATAFAGGTFHASPAPSSLPLPSFAAKATPDTPGSRGALNGAQQPSPPPTDSEDSTPLQLSSSNSDSEGLTLDVIFRLHREEQTGRRASSANSSQMIPGAFSPPSHSPKESRTVPKSFAPNQPRRSPHQLGFNIGIPDTELNGIPGQAIGPSFSSKSYQERIREARAVGKQPQSPSQNPPQASSVPESPSTADMTAALKNFLFHGEPPRSSPQSASGPTQGYTRFTPMGQNQTVPQTQRVSAAPTFSTF